MNSQELEVQTCKEISLQEIAIEAKSYIDNAKSENTRRAYASDWQDFSAWCGRQRLSALPAAPETVTLYVSALARRCRPATISRRLASISQAHAVAQKDSPTKSRIVRDAMQGIRCALGVAQTQKLPVTVELLRRMTASEPERLIGFAGAFRRSEIASLNLEDIAFVEAGIEIVLRRSKTDQEGEGRKVALSYGSKLHTCPVRSLKAWIEAAGISGGALFRSIDRHDRMKGRLSDRGVGELVKKKAASLGLDASKFAGHSLRAGFATSAAAAGVSERIIQKQTGHKGVVILRRYIRDSDLWRENAAAEVGL